MLLGLERGRSRSFHSTARPGARRDPEDTRWLRSRSSIAEVGTLRRLARAARRGAPSNGADGASGGWRTAGGGERIERDPLEGRRRDRNAADGPRPFDPGDGGQALRMAAADQLTGRAVVSVSANRGVEAGRRQRRRALGVVDRAFDLGLQRSQVLVRAHREERREQQRGRRRQADSRAPSVGAVFPHRPIIREEGSTELAQTGPGPGAVTSAASSSAARAAATACRATSSPAARMGSAPGAAGSPATSTSGATPCPSSRSV